MESGVDRGRVRKRSIEMDVLEALSTRKSVRGFKPDPVPREILREILQVSSRAPSAVNSQPWEFFVLTGDVIENIKRGNIEKARSGALPEPDNVAGKTAVPWPADSVYRRRQVALAKQLFQLMEIGIGDTEKKREWMERGLRFFDAPAAIVIVVDDSISGKVPLLDIGAIMQSICLSALSHGLGTCIEDQAAMYPQVMREFAGIPESKRIVISIAVGYPDWDFPANKVESGREPIDSLTRWCGFE
jgi:nitroreductase